MREYIKENITLHPTNPAIKIYNSYTWVSGVSPAGEIYIIKNDGLYYEDIKIVANSSGAGYSLTGEVSYYAGATSPDGWLICDGSTYNVADYPALAVALGYSSSDVTFNVPDFRQCTLKGANTTDGSGVITPASIPAHTHNSSLTHEHSVSTSNHTHNILCGYKHRSKSGANTNKVYGNTSNTGTATTGWSSVGNSGTTDSVVIHLSYNKEATLMSPHSDLTLNDDDIVRSYQCGVNVIIRT